MKYTLLLRFKAPMQSWGAASRFSIRDTGKEPSKSGVIGLLCAALGIRRDGANLDNPQFKALTELKMAVRVLREGVLQKDYHTAQNIAKADGGIKDTELSTRWFLADADFLVGLEGGEADLELLENLQEALKRPKWQIFFGRKAFTPMIPLYFKEGIFENDEANSFIESDAVQTLLTEYSKKLNLREIDWESQRLIFESETGSEIRQDVPICLKTRRFSMRRVEKKFIEGGREDGDLSYENES